MGIWYYQQVPDTYQQDTWEGGNIVEHSFIKSIGLNCKSPIYICLVCVLISSLNTNDQRVYLCFELEVCCYLNIYEYRLFKIM